MPVAAARSINVSVWPRNQTRCDTYQSPALFMAEDTATTITAPGHNYLLRTHEGVIFRSAEHNTVPVEPGRQYRFWAGNLAEGISSNVWVHAADARTYYPEPVVPTGYTYYSGDLLESRIQIVYSHDGQGHFAPVEQATQANIAVDLLKHRPPGSREPLESVPPEYDAPLTLWIARGNGLLEPTAYQPEKVLYEADGEVFPRWHFNDVAVEPGQQYHFVVWAGTHHFSIWTHAADPRTILPNPQLPPPVFRSP